MSHTALYYAVLTVCAALCLQAPVHALTPVTVHAPVGPIVGYEASIANAFRGIPFAKPPVGDLRWAPTEPIDPWTTPFVAQADAPGCPQDCTLPKMTCPPVMDESCLFLNVFTPKNATPSSNLPVMAFVPGGDLLQGYAGGLLYDGSWLASQHNVIIVVMQYRLGALGFLYTDFGFEGNYGILDQQEAFRWIQTNIAAFGGNPQQVTGFGQSAGGISIGTHLVLPSSKGLFQNAIMESNPFGLPFRSPKTWKPQADDFAKYAGCDKHSNYTDCLMKASMAAIIGAQTSVDKDLLADLSDFLSLFLPWTPTVGTDFLPVLPMELFQQGKAHDIPWMAGTVANEGVMFVFSAFKKPLSKVEYDVLLAALFGLDDSIKIGKRYPVPANETDDCRYNLAKIGTQGLFVCATRNVSLAVSGMQQSPVHVYHYDHLMSFRDWIWGKNYSFCDTSVCHGSELVPLFHPPVKHFNQSFDAAEDVMSASMGEYWTNLAKTGSPGSFNGIDFKAVQMATQYSMKLQTPQDDLLSKAYEEECEFWTTLGWWEKHFG